MLNKKHVPNSSAGEQAIIAGVRRLGTVDYIGVLANARAFVAVTSL